MSYLSEFLFKHNASKLDKTPTHTRIGSHDLNIHGGSFRIEEAELSIFYQLYHEHVFVKNNKEYLTEKQLENAGPILVDFDFRYEYSVTERPHNEGHVIDIVQLYLE